MNKITQKMLSERIQQENQSVENQSGQKEINSSIFSQEYLQGCKDSLIDHDKRSGNGDGKYSADEFFSDHMSLHKSLFGKDAAKFGVAANIAMEQGEIAKKYAGEDGVFDAQEFADFLNSEEYGRTLDEYWTLCEIMDSEGAGIFDSDVYASRADSSNDGKTTTTEFLEHDLNQAKGIFGDNPENFGNAANLTLEKNEIMQKYAGDDGVLDNNEYEQMVSSSEYKNVMQKFWDLMKSTFS